MKAKLALAILATLCVAAFSAPASLLLAQGKRGDKGGGSSPRLVDCLVSLINEAQVAAQEPGVLIELKAFEGQQVQEDEQVAQIEDSQPRFKGQAARAELNAAKEKAANDVDIRYAKAASDVAKAELDVSLEAVKNTPRSVSRVEINRQELTWKRGKLEIERAQSEQKIAGLTADVKKVEVDAALEAVQRHKIRSPIAGQVVQVHLHKGEWVKPGDPVLRVVNLERLRVDGFVNIGQFGPAQLIDRPVVVDVLLQGRKVSFNGKIMNVSPLVESRGDYQVTAHVENRKENNHWLLLPGLSAEMEIKAQ
jgi:multidrug resistance efflux pump